MNSSISHTRVLCFSRDATLLRTRCKVLEKQYETVSVGSLEELASLPPGSRFDLIILCHTLSSRDCQIFTEMARTYWPEAKILSVDAGEGHCSPDAVPAVAALDGPRVLLRMTQEMLQIPSTRNCAI